MFFRQRFFARREIGVSILSCWVLGCQGAAFDVRLTMMTFVIHHMGGCPNSGPFWGTLDNRCRMIIGTPKWDHNFDNHPHGGHDTKGLGFCGLGVWGFRL